MCGVCGEEGEGRERGGRSGVCGWVGGWGWGGVVWDGKVCVWERGGEGRGGGRAVVVVVVEVGGWVVVGRWGLCGVGSCGSCRWVGGWGGGGRGERGGVVVVVVGEGGELETECVGSLEQICTTLSRSQTNFQICNLVGNRALMCAPAGRKSRF